MSKDDRDGRKGGAHKSGRSLYNCKCVYCLRRKDERKNDKQGLKEARAWTN